MQIGLALWRELEQPAPAGKLYAQTTAQLLAVHLLRSSSAVRGIEEPSHGLTHQQMRHVLDFVQAHPDRELSLEVLAQQTGFSPYHFARLFRHTTGESPHQFVLHQRIERAQRLLDARELPLVHVASVCGFANQIANLLVSGLPVLAFALGMRQVLHGSPGGTWGPLLVGVYGLGLIGAGIFTAEPAFGFPPGAGPDAQTISWHGLLHFISAAIGFLALIAACMVMARRFASQGLRGWAIYSVVSGILFLAAFVGVATGSGQSWSVIGFWIGILFIWAWIWALAMKLFNERIPSQSQDGQ